MKYLINHKVYTIITYLFQNKNLLIYLQYYCLYNR